MLRLQAREPETARKEIVQLSSRTPSFLSLPHNSLATASHWETEGGQGATFVSLNGQLMQAYMDRYNVSHDDFAPWALTAHANAQTADHAVFRGKSLDFKTYSEADTITGPVKVRRNAKDQASIIHSLSQSHTWYIRDSLFRWIVI